MPQLNLKVVGSKVKISKPAVMAFVTSVALAAASLGISFSERVSNCVTFDTISCPESKQVKHLEKLKALGAPGARAAILTTVAQYQSDDELVADGIEEAYSYARQSNTECLVTALQKYVKSGWIASDNKDIKGIIPIAEKSRTLSVAARHMPFDEKAPARSLTPVVNRLRHCVSSHSLSTSQVVAHQEACDTDHHPVAEGAYCISDAIQGITRSEVYRLQKNAEGAFEAAPLPNTDVDLGGDTSAEPREDTDVARSSEPTQVATPTAKPTPSPTQAAPKTSPTPRPSKSPVSTPTAPAAPELTYTPPPEYSENVRPIPTPYAPVEPDFSPEPLLEHPERLAPPSAPTRETRNGTTSSQPPVSSRAS